METPKTTHKLPHLPRRSPPAGEPERLSRWFRERDLDLRLRKAMPREYVEALRTPPPEERPKRPTELSKLIAPFDPDIKTGEIRILKGGLFAEWRRIMYVAILGEWDDKESYSEEKLFLVAPFGDYSVPATTTEWLTGREVESLRVLCLWNSRTYRVGALEQSWLIGENLTAQELADAREVFRHSMTGVPLSDRVRAQVGAPIVHPRDPRLEYQREEAQAFTIIHDKR